MNIIIQRRANIALLSLAQNEQKQILKALARIESLNPEDLWKWKNLDLKKLRGDFNTNTYLYRGNQRLRIVLSFQDNVCIVEDIVARDKLDRLIPDFT